MISMLLALSLQAAPPPAPATASPAAVSMAIDDGLRLFKRHRFSAAESEFRKAVEADPKSAAAHFYLGYTLYKLGEPTRRMNPQKTEARAEFARAYELEANFRPIWAAHK